MKKLSILAGVAVISASVFGMETPLNKEANKEQNSSFKQEITQIINGEDPSQQQLLVKKVLNEICFYNNPTYGILNFLNAYKNKSAMGREEFSHFLAEEVWVASKKIKEFDGIATFFKDIYNKNKETYGKLLEECSNKYLKLYKSFCGKKIDLPKLFEECGFDINGVYNDQCLLQYVCETGDENLVNFILDCGADVNNSNVSEGGSPVIGAFNNGKYEMVKYLVDKGADAKYLLKQIILANTTGSEIIEYVIKKGKNIKDYLNQKDDNGSTLLFYACYENNLKIVECLVDAGAVVTDETNKSGESLLSIAQREGNTKMIDYLNQQMAKK